MTRVHISKRSSNSKVGKIPVTTSEAGTCPTTCPMFEGCYAKTGPQSWHWRKVTEGERGGSWDDLTNFVSSLDAGQLWRHNVSGDLPHHEGHIDLRQLFDLVQANKSSGAKGYTYTHHLLFKNNKPVHHNIEAIKYANNNGFTINASCESLEQSDRARALGLPAVCVVPSDRDTPTHTPAGHKVTICPAQLHDKVSCSTCKLCSHSNRSQVVAFLSHGARAKKVNAKLNG